MKLVMALSVRNQFAAIIVYQTDWTTRLCRLGWFVFAFLKMLINKFVRDGVVVFFTAACIMNPFETLRIKGIVGIPRHEFANEVDNKFACSKSQEEDPY